MLTSGVTIFYVTCESVSGIMQQAVQHYYSGVVENVILVFFHPTYSGEHMRKSFNYDEHSPNSR